jgi:hypothetical protein
LLEEAGQLKQAIDTNDLETVKLLMTRNQNAVKQHCANARPKR